MNAHAPPVRDRRPGVTVLMSTHAGETAANLAASLGSIRAQTLPPDRIVLVLDGPVGADQEAVIAASLAAPALDVVRLLGNVGLAAAMNEGLAHCPDGWVMRMDSDDLCQPDRLAVQMAYAAANPGIDVISSWSEEFYEDGAASQIKVSATGHDAVVQALRWRNVLVHPTILARTEALRRIGGYRADYGRLEDYDLFVRLAQSGARFHVIPKVLVRVRSSTAQKQRRGGLAYCLSELRFRIACYRSGFLTLRQFATVTPLYLGFRLASGRAKRALYRLARTTDATA
ncbi:MULTISPECIES: glycosyltransferase [unclassified Methylobacterium]|uniref:glycosyltransferase n=1 Tax=unclassified Methylobacterium TaxID=2615210 RepID=UPI00226A004D|nr:MULTISPECIES: glycosyltransferase [unclassified Methylobacterium]